MHEAGQTETVLVAEDGGTAQPKVIDFGIPKAMRGRLTERTLVTQLGLPLGTPEYLSPEQAAMAEADIDTTTDIYSLGVILNDPGLLLMDAKRLPDADAVFLARGPPLHRDLPA